MRNDDVRPYPMIASGDDTRLAHFREHGWLRVPGVFPAEEVAELAEYATARAASQAPDPTNRTATDIGADGRAAPRKLAFPARDDARFRDFALDARLQALLTGLFGGTPLLVMDHVFLKAPEIGGPKYLHQDNFYFHLDPPEAGVSSWIALDDADADNGCLQYVSGSHRGGLLAHGFPPDEPRNAKLSGSPPAEPVLVPARRGDVILHHLLCVHGSGANRSPRWRRAYALHWLLGPAAMNPAFLAQANFRDPDYPEHAALRRRFPSLFA